MNESVVDVDETINDLPRSIENFMESKLREETSDEVQPILEPLLESKPRSKRSSLESKPRSKRGSMDSQPKDDQSDDEDDSGLIFASSEGDIDWVLDILDDNSGLPVDEALLVACQNGHEKVVRALVREGAEANPSNHHKESGWTCLHFAASRGHDKVVSFLLSPECGVRDCDYKDYIGNTPLHLCCAEGRTSTAGILLDNDAHIDERNHAGDTPLGLAVWHNHAWASGLLLGRGANKESINNAGFRPIHLAAHRGAVKALTVLIEKGAGLDFSSVTEHEQNNALHLAAKMGQVEIANMLVKAEPKLCGQFNHLGWLPVHSASANMGSDLIFSMLEKYGGGSHINTRTRDDGMQPMHLAAHIRSDKFIGILLRLGADLDSLDNLGRTPLICAAAEGNDIAVRLILEKCGKTKGKKQELLNVADKQGNIAIHYAAANGHLSCVKLFLETAYSVSPGKDSPPLFHVDVCNRRGESPLLLAAGGSNMKLIECLLDNKGGGANIEGGGSETHPCFVTPLMRACECGQIKVALLLLQRGADKEARDSRGLTPLHYAAAGGHVLMVYLLLEQGVCMTAVDHEGWNALFYAVLRNNHFDIVKLLLDKCKNIEDQDSLGNTALIRACEKEKLPMINYLLDKGAKVNCINHKHHTPLHKATEKGQLEVMRMLIARGASINAASRNGLTPLHKAVDSYVDNQFNGSAISLLLSHTTDNINAPDTDGNTPLARACWRGKLEAFELLLAAGADVTTTNKAGKTLLHWAVDECHEGIFQRLLSLAQEGKISLDARENKQQRTALHLAAGLKEGKESFLLALIEAGADIEAADEKGETPLHNATKQGGISLVTSLLARGADMEALSHDHRTSLLHAIDASRPDIIAVLLNAGANLFCEDKNGLSSMHLAAKTGNCRIVELFLEKAFQVPSGKTLGITSEKARGVSSDLVNSLLNNLDANKHAPLYLAAYHGHAEMITLLLAHGADVATVARQGRNSLHVAAIKGHPECCKVLIQIGRISVDSVDRDGCQPLHLAIEKGHYSTVSTLIELYADPIFKTGRGLTPLHLAASKGHIEIVRLLLKQYGVNIRLRDDFGNTILHYAVESGNVNMLKAILRGEVENFVKVKSVRPSESEKPSAKGLGKASTKALFGRAIGMVGAVPGSKNAFAKSVSALMMQGAKNKTLIPPLDEDELLELEVIGDVDIHATNNLGHTALHVSARKGHVASINVLLNFGADLECRDRDGETPLHWTAICGHRDAAAKLLQRGANVEEHNSFGDTALHWCAKKGHTDVARLLINVYNASQECVNLNKCTPLHVAVEAGHKAMVKFLLESDSVEVPLVALDGKGDTALTLSQKGNNVDINKMVVKRLSMFTDELGPILDNFNFGGLGDPGPGPDVLLPISRGGSRGGSRNGTRINRDLMMQDSSRGDSRGTNKGGGGGGDPLNPRGEYRGSILRGSSRGESRGSRGASRGSAGVTFRQSVGDAIDDEAFAEPGDDASANGTGLADIPISTDTNLDFMDGFAN